MKFMKLTWVGGKIRKWGWTSYLCPLNLSFVIYWYFSVYFHSLPHQSHQKLIKLPNFYVWESLNTIFNLNRSINQVFWTLSTHLPKYSSKSGKCMTFLERFRLYIRPINIKVMKVYFTLTHFFMYSWLGVYMSQTVRELLDLDS